MQSQTPPLGDTVSHFRLLERLGQGGMGVVYKALDMRLERVVALKFLAAERGESVEARRRLLHEGRAASALDHPNICTLYEMDESEDGRLFLAMAFCEGETLKSRIGRGPLALGTALDFAAQVAAGLGAAHEKGIVHRDVKPSNLMVTPDGRIRIVDFGIARRPDQTVLTHDGIALGSTPYMSPEQLRAEGVDPRTDLWSLGVVLYEMLTGELPFAGSERELVSAILQREPPPLAAWRPGVTPAIQRIVTRALAKPVGRRYPSAAAMRADLLAVEIPAIPAMSAMAVGASELEETLIEVPRPATAATASKAARPPGEKAAALAFLPGETVAHYRMAAPLGGGAMGVIYQAEDTRLGRTVALKFLAPERTRDPGAKERFLKEARAASALDHPNLCTVHEVGETAAGQLYLAMACYDGETLARRIERGPLPLAEALDLACQAARGLAKAHGRGIVHRDVKPANLMVTGDGLLKILDFGIAQLVGEAAPGSLSGTPVYMSPEQARGEGMGPATDVWSLGVVLYEMLAGHRPFRGGSTPAVLHAIRSEEPEPLPRLRPEIPAEVARIVSRMLAKDPAARFPTAAEALADLEAARSATTAVQVPRRRARSFAAAALLAAGLAAGALLLWQRDRAPAPLQVTFTRLTDLEGRESFPSLAPDGTLFAYAKTVGGRSHLFLQRLEGGSPVDLSPDSAGDDLQPAFSPDGRRIAFRSEREGGGIFLMGITGPPARRLTDFGYNPVWSPDGSEIACATEGISNPSIRQGKSQLWIVRVATGERRLATPGDAVQPSWSPDGRRLAYWSLPPPGGNRVLWTVPVAGGDPVRVLGDFHLNWSPAWSPDGRYLYFASDRAGSMNLWRVPIDEGSGAVRGEPEPVTTSSQWSGPLSLSRDGRHLLYATDDGRSNLERVAFDPVAGRAVGPLLPVTQGSRKVRSGDLSPDGRSIVFDTAGSREDLFVVGADGGRARQLTNDDFKDRSPRWSPDGRSIVFYSNRGGRYGIWTIRPDGGGLAPLPLPGEGPFYLPLWFPDGRRLVYLRGAETMLYDPAGLGSAPLPIPADFSPGDLSPDGRWLAGSEARGVDLYSFASRRFERLARTGAGPVWLGDSRRLLYVDGGKVWAVDRVTRAVREVLAPPASSTFSKVAVSRDGRDLCLVREVEEGDIWLLTLR